MEIEELDPLAAWDWPSEPTAALLESGLINDSWAVLVDDEPVAVMQQLNLGIFNPTLHHDIYAVTQHLRAKGRATTELLRTRQGELWHEDAEGNVWRCLTWVGDRTQEQLDDPSDAKSAGFLVARFHAAMFGWRYDFKFTRPGAHDTVVHMAKLQHALVTHRNARLRPKVTLVADQILDQWRLWDGISDLPQRIIHGDLKISNVRFQGPDALTLIDLDTMQWGTLDVELGDMLRSWCNLGGEDAATTEFNLEFFEAAMTGYCEGAKDLPFTRKEWRSIVPGIERISLELAARFARDALEESYFAWDASRFDTPGAHNLVRAKAMAALALSVHHQADEAEAILTRIRRDVS
ncbi:MAG: Ser/Thr protein kinase RdoA (MazF antagonist) [Kiritimatiellia bacterium]|jgi:Ser/Thr protein kinase RdoA (MazF antagonist)